MRIMRRRFLLVLLALLVPGLAGAQGLGDVAARERQKREAAGSRPKARVLSNDDLPKDSAKKGAAGDAAASGDSTAARTTSGLSQAAREGTSPEADAADPRQAQLAQAQAEVDNARAAVAAAEGRVKDLADKLNPMSPSFIYGAVQTGDAVGEEMRTREGLKQAEAQLAQAREGLVAANQAQERVSRGQPARPPEDR